MKNVLKSSSHLIYEEKVASIQANIYKFSVVKRLIIQKLQQHLKILKPALYIFRKVLSLSRCYPSVSQKLPT